jgi:hypothetical protein
MAEGVNLTYGSGIATLSEDLGMRCVSATFVSWLLTKEQK